MSNPTPAVSSPTPGQTPTSQPLEASTQGPTSLPGVEDVMGVLRGVIDPELGSDIVELGMARGAVVQPDGLVEVNVALTTSGCPLRAQIQRDVRARVGNLPGVTKVKIHWSELTQEQKATAMAKARFNVSQNAPDTTVPITTKVVMVASGKGGVGKSSITVNLAAELAQRKMRVGVMDADIWGYSVPRMLGVEGRLAGVEGEKKIVPNEKQVGAGVLEVVSMGFLVDKEETALMWRGLILNRAVKHFLEDVRWGQLDYLLIDMPPGTGDVQMGIAKMLPQAEMVVVTTPARSAQKVAARVASMGRSNYLRIAGVIENMSEFVDPQGNSYPIFGSGGGKELAEELGVPLWGQVPIDGLVATGGDEGTPTVLGQGSGPAAQALRQIADRLLEEIPKIDMAGCTARIFEAANEALANLEITAS
ncbi:MAG: Mrp/NBP35 family ATP-binding protein [bacterium]|nr:Mrp/NBP35 family ATP-binding protein [bacterium]